MKTLPMFIALSLLGVTAASAAEQVPVKKVEVKQTDAKQADTKQADAKQVDAKTTDTKQDAAHKAANPVELDTTQITGNRELPRVLYVVPWKRADLGDSSGKPAKSLLDEVLAPVDRDVFRRQNRYHDALQPDAAAGNADAPGVEPKVEPKVER